MTPRRVVREFREERSDVRRRADGTTVQSSTVRVVTVQTQSARAEAVTRSNVQSQVSVVVHHD